MCIYSIYIYVYLLTYLYSIWYMYHTHIRICTGISIFNRAQIFLIFFLFVFVLSGFFCFFFCLCLFCCRARFPAICNIWGPRPVISHAICTLLDLRLLFCLLFAHFWTSGFYFACYLHTFGPRGLFRVCLVFL